MMVKQSLLLLLWSCSIGCTSASWWGGGDTDDQSGGLAVAVMVKQTEVDACNDEELMAEGSKLQQHLNKAVEIGLQTELLAGPPHPPEGSTMVYPEHQFTQDVRESLHEVQRKGLPWAGEQGGDAFSDFKKDEDESRRLKNDDFCDIVCSEVQKGYYCVCACAEGRCDRRRRLSPSDEDNELRDGGLRRGLAKPEEQTKEEYNSRESVLARFKKKYHKSFWEYVMAEEVAEEFMKRKTEEDDYECVDDNLDMKFIVVRTLHD
ncbi:expressed unknown protein [Seminavis robusta]|uniref:Uncharacterized protein n=1 Tax=Seminavis robusta TaxID=568900 RepID=A0A9N8EP93_9STRA|nr:expressed unknown protein [Seminavis robusta]|eukprot:Sro1328_g263190.1 n/a (262) ;mRNA; f:14403-15188